MSTGDTKFRADITKPHQEALKALTQKADNALTSEDKTLGDARSKIASAVSDISNRYGSLAAEADSRNQQEQATPQGRVYRFLDGLWNTITGWVESVRQWFQKQFGDFWGGLLFGILSTIVVILVVVAVIALLSEELAFVGTVLVIGGIGLLIHNRFQEFAAAHGGQGPNFWQGLGLSVLGILDITGIPFIIEGVVGKTATGLDLSTFERGERIGSEAVMLITFGYGVKKMRSMSPKTPGETTAPGETAVPEEAATGTKRASLIKELEAQGIKHSPEKIIWIMKRADGKIIFLEEGYLQSGLNHVLHDHVGDFANRGISEAEIPEVIQKALEANNVIGYQGKGTGRPIYEVVFNGKTLKVAITVGNNGYVVGANPQ